MNWRDLEMKLKLSSLYGLLLLVVVVVLLVKVSCSGRGWCGDEGRCPFGGALNFNP